MVQVQLGAAEGALQVFGIGGEPVELLIDVLLVRMILELEAGADAIEQVGVLRRGEPGDRVGSSGAWGSTTSGDWAEGGVGGRG